MEELLVDRARHAMKARLRDGYLLLERKQYVGAAYIGGYAGEMALECAFFSLPGGRQWLASEWKDALKYAKALAAGWGIEDSHEGYHNPVFWARLLNCAVKRNQQLTGAEVSLIAPEKKILLALQLRNCWSPELRYRYQGMSYWDANLALQSSQKLMWSLRALIL